jgi:hypothetical protein
MRQQQDCCSRSRRRSKSEAVSEAVGAAVGAAVGDRTIGTARLATAVRSAPEVVRCHQVFRSLSPSRASFPMKRYAHLLECGFVNSLMLMKMWE